MADQLREYCVGDIVKLLKILENDGMMWSVNDMDQTIQLSDLDGGGRPLYEIDRDFDGTFWRINE